MEPTIHCAKPKPACRGSEDQEVVASEIDGDPKRGDIVVVELRLNQGSKCGWTEPGQMITRIVGLPGEAIRVTSKSVSINGKTLAEPYLDTGGMGLGGAWTTSADEYFVLGDNRFYSCDSRIFGSVPGESNSHRVDA